MTEEFFCSLSRRNKIYHMISASNVLKIIAAIKIMKEYYELVKIQKKLKEIV